MLLDPARAGAAGVMEHLIKLMPEKLSMFHVTPQHWQEIVKFYLMGLSIITVADARHVSAN